MNGRILRRIWTRLLKSAAVQATVSRIATDNAKDHASGELGDRITVVERKQDELTADTAILKQKYHEMLSLWEATVNGNGNGNMGN